MIKLAHMLRPEHITSAVLLPPAISAYASSSLQTHLLRIAGLALVYFLAARLGLQLQFYESQATPVWPPSGIAIGVAFLFGVRVLPGVFVGAFVANLLDFYVKGMSGSDTVLAAALIGMGNTCETWLAIVILRQLLAERFISDTVSDISGFVMSIGVACLLSAGLGVVTLAAFGFLPITMMPMVFFTWWIGDVMGGMLLVPGILLLWGRGAHSASELGQMFKPVLVPLMGVALMSVLAFLLPGNFLLAISQASLLLPVLMLLTLRFGRILTVLAIPLIALIAVLGTINGTGPFAREDSNSALILSLVFVSILVFSLLLLDAIRYEGQCAASSLEQANALLEQRVIDRTQQLEQANSELERSNRDLDDFAYIASHDLKEPLRGIQNLIAFLIEDYGEQMSAEMRERLDKISPVADHLESLVETLLFYSRVGRTEMAMAMVDMDEVLDQVLKSLAGCIATDGVEIRRKLPLPASYCDHARIGEVFQNLLTNALKYNDKPQRWVEIGAFEQDNETVFYVADNGIGIQEKHFARVFQIFRRLHSQDKFGGGTGAGMTICQKIVERHGGRIWIESSVGVGSRFCFTLPTLSPEMHAANHVAKVDDHVG